MKRTVLLCAHSWLLIELYSIANPLKELSGFVGVLFGGFSAELPHLVASAYQGIYNFMNFVKVMEPILVKGSDFRNEIRSFVHDDILHGSR